MALWANFRGISSHLAPETALAAGALLLLTGPYVVGVEATLAPKWFRSP